jgi:hypothetical protein
MDQAPSANQGLLRHQRERREDPNLDCRLGLRAGGHRPQAYESGLESSLYQILQILSLTLFEKTPILQALQASDSQEEFLDPGNQLILFDF